MGAERTGHHRSGAEEADGRSGLIFNIQKYSIHDGPGIRTTVFLKGCPLRCGWCSNPESMQHGRELLVRRARCTGCGRCVDVCSPRAIELAEDAIRIDRSRCDLCLKCANVCYAEAIEVSGRTVGVGDVVDECEKDEIFYRNSGGGVTLSGGEPLFQAAFTREILRECKARSLHTALDTSGHAPREVLERALPYTDLILFDIKHLDPGQHHAATGVDNNLILENLRMIARAGTTRLWIRLPVIPGFNDGEAYMEAVAAVLKDVPAEKISLLGYHEWGKPKYEALGRAYPLDGATPPSDERLQALAGLLAAAGLPVTVGY